MDLARHSDGAFYVLEDNLCVPSGVSYMLESRKMMRRLFPELFARLDIAPVEHYASLLLTTLREASPVAQPTVVVLTPAGITRLILSMRFWRGKWALSWWKARICLCKTTGCGCAPPPARRRWM